MADVSKTDDASRLGLGVQISVLFAAGGLLVSVLVGGTTLALTRQQLLETRGSDAAAMAVSNATRLSNQLTPESSIEDLPTIVDSLTRIGGSQRIIRVGDDWLVAPEMDRADLPASLVARLGDRRPGQMLALVRGQPRFVVGIPLAAFDADYYAISDLSEVEQTLNDLSYVLLGTSAIAVTLAALLGSWTASRVLRPLRRVREAAEAIAGGRLDTRLVAQADPDLDRLSDSFNEMARALESRIQRDARFASDVSHELRSPLTTLMAGVGVLKSRREELSPRSIIALDLLVADLERFNRLVNDLLEISVFDAGVAALDLTDVGIARFLEVTAANAGAVELRMPNEAHGVVVQADKRRLARIMSNLLDNAGRYGGGATAIILEMDDTLRIIVEDGGAGIPVGERLSVFDRFFRGSTGGRRTDDGGTGLGLSLVVEDLRLHNGSVWVEDRRDGRPGARFVLELPLPEVDA